MTVSVSSNKSSVYASGSASHSFPFLLLAESHLQVWYKSAAGVLSKLTLNSDYTVRSGSLNNPSGGNIDFITGHTPASGGTVQLFRVVPLIQDTDITNSGPWYPETHEAVFDKLTMQLQQLSEAVDRSVKVTIMSELTADGFMEDIEDIKTDAETANTAANNALLAASVAQESADNAIESANAALITTGQNLSAAVSAKEAAETAQGKAEDAQEAAEAAQSTASSASSTAVTAKDNAILAKQAAETAQGLAEGAASDAEDSAELAQAYAEQASTVTGVPLPALAADITEGTSTDKFATPKAIKDAGIVATPVKASSAEITSGTDDAKFATAKAIKDAGITATPVKASGVEIAAGTDDAKFATAKAIKDAGIGETVLTETANTDGFSIAGGTTSRQLDVSGGNVGLVGGGISQYFVPLTVDRANSTVTIADCTGLSATLESGKTYLFKFRVRYTTAVYTTGIFLSVNGPTFTAGTLSIDTLLPLANTTNMAPSHLGAYDAGVVSTGAGTGTGDNGRVFYTEVCGTVKTTASGTLILRFRSEVAGSAATIKAGSLLELIKVD